MTVDEMHELTPSTRGSSISSRNCTRPSSGSPARRRRRRAHARMKRLGFGDRQLARMRGESEAAAARAAPRARRAADLPHGRHVCRRVPAATPYLYSSYEIETEAPPSGSPQDRDPRQRPNRIGQGIEFDYCCVQAALALRDDGFETIMVNSNPETVSTDFDISDKLYFEPLTLEDVLEIVEREKAGRRDRAARRPDAAQARQAARGSRRPILGTSVDEIDRAEDRDRFAALCREIGATCRRTASPPAWSRPSGRGRRRLPRARAPVLRAGRPRHGDRLRRAVAARLLRARRARVARPSRAHRPLPRGRVRGRCRLPVRRHRRRHRRRHAAHRGCGRALRRLRVRAAAVHAARMPRSRRCAASPASSRTSSAWSAS
jgi:hypothetical protein